LHLLALARVKFINCVLVVVVSKTYALSWAEIAVAAMVLHEKMSSKYVGITKIMTNA
jgi:hypothetical protein